MRRLLIKLVAIETALVGWLSYWLFLVYADNPSVSQGLGNQLSRFPQLVFTTVDIAVLVVIVVFSVALAYKFHRGLRPGIRLERALQMLENLMKRNLILEAQVAELRVDKIHLAPSQSASSLSVPRLLGPSFSAGEPSPPSEPRSGSWEKAFRTPLEAGLPAPSKVSSPSVTETPFQHETGIPPPRIELKPVTTSLAKPPLVISEKTGSSVLGIDIADKSSEKPTAISMSPSSSSGWEDSPKYVGETTGVLTPSAASRKAAPVTSDSSGLRQPYIPVPAPRMTPPSVIVGPMNQKAASPAKPSPRPIVRPPFPSQGSSRDQSTSSPAPEQKATGLSISIDRSNMPKTDLKPPEANKLAISSTEETKGKPAGKAETSKKRFSYEED